MRGSGETAVVRDSKPLSGRLESVRDVDVAGRKRRRLQPDTLPAIGRGVFQLSTCFFLFFFWSRRLNALTVDVLQLR